MATIDGLARATRKNCRKLTDILERLVLLEHLLDTGGGVVVVLTDDTGVQHTGLGVQRVDSWVDTQLGDTTGKHSGGVQVGEGGGGSRVSQIVSRHVDGLYGSDGTLLCGSDTFLHQTHVDGESWLVTDGRWNTTEQGRYFGTGLRETENVVNEEQHILPFFVSEVLSDSKLQGLLVADTVAMREVHDCSICRDFSGSIALPSGQTFAIVEV